MLQWRPLCAFCSNYGVYMTFFHNIDAWGKPTVCSVYPLWGVSIYSIRTFFSRFSINAFIWLREAFAPNLNSIYQFFSVLMLETLAACAACTLFGETRVLCTEKAKPFVRYWLWYKGFQIWSLYENFHSLDAFGKPTVCTVYLLWRVLHQFFSVLMLWMREAYSVQRVPNLGS